MSEPILTARVADLRRRLREAEAVAGSALAEVSFLRGELAHLEKLAAEHKEANGLRAVVVDGLAPAALSTATEVMP